MFNPPHPGEVIKEICLEPLGLSITKAAEGLGVSRKALSELVNGKSGVSSEMAIQLEKAFGASTKSWMEHQIEYDLWQAQKKAKKIKVKKMMFAS